MKEGKSFKRWKEENGGGGMRSEGIEGRKGKGRGVATICLVRINSVRCVDTRRVKGGQLMRENSDSKQRKRRRKKRRGRGEKRR